ncbi:unnamed protein product [Meloidogyne enterolobii]|uniref:Uncharacterized protein n=1 Tax=Meloidogyne enterolobii TaxID=390850 RepID=A0ACB0YA44_MELEN
MLAQMLIGRKEGKKRYERVIQLLVCRNWTDDPRFSPMNYKDLSDLLHFVWSLENMGQLVNDRCCVQLWFTVELV